MTGKEIRSRSRKHLKITYFLTFLRLRLLIATRVCLSINVSFALRVSDLSAASRWKALLWLGNNCRYAISTGRLQRVYFEAVPVLC